MGVLVFSINHGKGTDDFYNSFNTTFCVISPSNNQKLILRKAFTWYKANHYYYHKLSILPIMFYKTKNHSFNRDRADEIIKNLLLKINSSPINLSKKWTDNAFKSNLKTLLMARTIPIKQSRYHHINTDYYAR